MSKARPKSRLEAIGDVAIAVQVVVLLCDAAAMVATVEEGRGRGVATRLVVEAAGGRSVRAQTIKESCDRGQSRIKVTPHRG
jgi:hypothetical protein